MTDIVDDSLIRAALVSGDDDNGVASILPYAPGVLHAGAAAPAASLAFVDTSVAGWQDLVDGIGQNAEVVLIPQTDDPLGFIADSLRSHGTVGSVHIISHGGEGFIQIGGHVIDAAALSAQSETLASWGAALGHGADILLYGCDTGEGAAGQNFVNAFAAATGADVAASDDLTGSAAQGGDWTLETHSGAIETASLDLSHSSFAGTLDATFNTANPHTIFGEANTTNSNHPGPGNVVLFDADGDGDLDFIDMQWDGSSPLYINNGSGVFTAGSSIAYSGRIEGTVAVDIDGDGDKDLISHLVDGSTKVQIFTNNGHGVFTAGTTLGSNNPTDTDVFTTGDVDGDGDIDIVVGINGGSKVYLNNGTGSFTESATLTNTAFPSSSINGIALIDFNGDGKLDIAIDADTIYDGDRSTTLFRNDGGGHFTSMGTIGGSAYSAGIFAADFNNDGKIDLFQNGDSLGHSRIYYNNGTFNPTPSGDDPLGAAFRPYNAIDIDGDGDIDFAAMSTTGFGQPAPTTTGYYINNGNGTFTLQQQNFPHSAGPNGTDSHEIVVSGDINGDGKPDTVVIAQHYTYGYDANAGGYIYTNDYTYAWYANQTGPQNAAPTAHADAVSATEAGGTANGTAGVNPSFNVIAGTGETVSTGADTDPDSGDTLTVQGVAAGTTQTAQTTGAGTDVTGAYGTIHINADGSATYTVNNANATVQALPDFASTLTDTFSYTIHDSGGLTSTTQVTITIHGANDAPTLDLDGSANGTGFEATYTENGTPQAIADTDAVIKDVDTGATVSSATVTLTNHQTGDILAVNGNLPNGITASSYDATTGVLTLTGSASAADYQTALHQIVFSNTTDDPSGTDRTITVSVSDGSLTSGSATATIHVTPVNDAPTLTATGADTSYTENGSPTDLFSGVSVSTVESGQSIKSVTLTVSGLHDGASETITLDGTSIALTDGASSQTATNGLNYSVSVLAGVATVTFGSGGGVSASLMASIIDGIGYSDLGENPTAGTRTITLTSIHDTGGTADGGQDSATISIGATVNVVPVNDAPTANDNTLALDQRTTQLGNLITDAPADTDPENNTLTVTSVSFNATPHAVTSSDSASIAGQYGTLTVASDGSYSYAATVEGAIAVGATGVDVFDYTISDGDDGTSTAHLNVTVTGASIGNTGQNIFLMTGPGTYAAGLTGDDTYIVDSQSDRPYEKIGAGDDTIKTSVSYALGSAGEIEHLQTTNALGTDAIDLTGNKFDNEIIGNAGDNLLNGGGGADTLIGGGGNDRYIVDASSVVIEQANGGIDTVYATTSYALSDNVENIRAYGALADLGVKLTGNTLANALYGGAGADTLVGGDGNDKYFVSTGDTVVEASGQGTDSVYTNVSFTLADNVEQLYAYNNGSTGLTLRGNGDANLIMGGAGADTIIGGAGTDKLYGGAGNDVFRFENLADGALGSYDRIYDFEIGHDKIDLRGVQAVTGAATDQMFSYIGESAFTKVAGQLHISFIGTTTTLIEGDVNGDAKADFRIALIGHYDLSGTDFML